MKSLKIDKLYKYFEVLILILILLSIMVKGARAQQLGDIGKPADYEQTIKTFSSTIYDSNFFTFGLPTSFDWRDMGIVTSAKEQGGCGGCWAFAAVGALESKMLMAGMSEYDLSEQQQISCNTSMSGCSSGSMNSLRFWETLGPMQENCTGYCACEGDCSDLENCSQMPCRVTGYYTVDTTDINEIKASLYNDGPTYFRFDVYSDFYSFWSSGNTGDVYVNTSNSFVFGHAVLIIGWDDSKNAWLCKNSWGTTDGPNGDGTFWIAYSGHTNNLKFGMANMELVRPNTVGVGIAGSNDHVYMWYEDGLVTSGTSWDLDKYKDPYNYALPSGYDYDDIAGIAIAGSNDHVYVWYKNGYVSSGTSRDLDRYRSPYQYSLPPGYDYSDIAGIAIAGSNDHVYVWYKNGYVSSGTSQDLDRYRSPYRYILPPGYDYSDIVGIAIAGSNDHVYVWYEDGCVSSGTSWDLDRYRDPYRTI